MRMNTPGTETKIKISDLILFTLFIISFIIFLVGIISNNGTLVHFSYPIVIGSLLFLRDNEEKETQKIINEIDNRKK